MVITMCNIVIIQDKGDYYSHMTQDNITEKVVDKNVIVAQKMSDEEFFKKFGETMFNRLASKETRHLIKTDRGELFFDEETGDKILRRQY